ncbi:hypothetical protein DBA29_21015 [Xenophilus aerolatus]|nr:hypothetical protein [Xenophilus aerolatus]
MSSAVSAVIAASVTLITAFVTQFLAERYRRFKDGAALAAGTAGELASYSDAVPLLGVSLRTAQEQVALGNMSSLNFRDFEKPQDRYFPKVVDKLGLLGPQLCEWIIYVYANLDAFRSALVLIHSKHSEMTADELQARIVLCVDAMGRAFSAGEELIEALRARSNERFRVLGP